MILKLLTYLTLSAIICNAPITAQNHVLFNNLDNNCSNCNWIGLNTIDSLSAYSGRFFSQTDSLNQYGLGIEQALPNDLVHENTMLIISGYVKSSTKHDNALYVVTLLNNGKSVLWKGIPLAPVFSEENTWNYFSDSILIPANITTNLIIKAYLWNQDKKATTGLDDLRFEFKKYNNPSFLPKIVGVVKKNEYSQNSYVLFKNTYYSITYNPANEGISISSNTDDTLINVVNYFSERDLHGINVRNQSQLHFVSSKNNDDGKVLKFKVFNNNFKININLICSLNSEKIIFKIEEKYKVNQTINRESLIFYYSQPLSQVYRNNRKSDINNFQKEYWLDKQGVKIGNLNNTTIIYHTVKISSLQMDTKNKFLVVNLDYEKDHPFFRFPLNPDSTDWKKDESSSKYKRGNRRNFEFSINVGNKTPTIPRFMKNPFGYEAAYIWTEHADFTDIKTNRATYFGSENISNADSAVGGFVKYNIPVTKSVFYDNPDSITNYEASNGRFPHLESTILTDSMFSKFLFQIARKGSSICLHTPEQFTTTQHRLNLALSYMQQNFGSASWIDHGNNNGEKNNREDLICDGTLKNSPYYAIDLWNKYGVKYLHNAYYEEFNTYKGWQFDSSLEKPYSGFGDFFPKPDYFQHPTRSSNIIHWTTTSALFVKEPYLWDYFFNINKLQNLINDRAVEINHSYPAWVNPKKGMWTYSADSTIVVQPGLNLALANMDKLRDDGKLNVCTIDNFLNYRTAIDSVKYQLLPDGRVRLTNNGHNKIKGLSMVALAKAASVDGIIPKQKHVDNEIIFWFDLDAGETKVIRIVE